MSERTVALSVVCTAAAPSQVSHRAVAAKASAATMLTADSGIASRRRLRDSAGAGSTAALGLFVSGLARSSIAEAQLGLSAAEGTSVATGAEEPDRSGTVRPGADASGLPSAIFSGRI